MWEEEDKESTATKPTDAFAFVKFQTVLKLVRNPDGAEEETEHNYKHPLAVQHAEQTSLL